MFESDVHLIFYFLLSFLKKGRGACCGLYSFSHRYRRLLGFEMLPKFDSKILIDCAASGRRSCRPVGTPGGYWGWGKKCGPQF